VKCKTCHGKSEEKGKFGSPRSESLCFKGGAPIMLGPRNENHKPIIANFFFSFFHGCIELFPILI